MLLGFYSPLRVEAKPSMPKLINVPMYWKNRLLRYDNGFPTSFVGLAVQR